MPKGMWPLRLLWAIRTLYKGAQFARLWGISLVNWLEKRIILSDLFPTHRSEGMGLVNWLVDASNSTSLDFLPNYSGMLPNRELFQIYKICGLGISTIPLGIPPMSLLQFRSSNVSFLSIEISLWIHPMSMLRDKSNHSMLAILLNFHGMNPVSLLLYSIIVSSLFNFPSSKGKGLVKLEFEICINSSFDILPNCHGIPPL